MIKVGRIRGICARTTAFGVKGCQQLGDQFSQSCPLATSHWTSRSVLLELLVVYYPRKLLSDIPSTLYTQYLHIIIR